MRVAYFGPEGTFTHEAVLAATDGEPVELVPHPTIHDTVMAVHDRAVERALVPMENSVEGSVNATLDALAFATDDVTIAGEVVRPIHLCLIARAPVPLREIEGVSSHPQPLGQCARYLRTELPQAAVTIARSTADAVSAVAASDRPLAAIGTRLAAELNGCDVLAEGIEDVEGNETRFVWLGPAGGSTTAPAGDVKTSLVFWGAGDEAPGWLVRCLAEFSDRGVNLTKIESRPRKIGLGHYVFFADLDGHADVEPVDAAIAGLATHVEHLRVLGSYPAA